MKEDDIIIRMIQWAIELDRPFSLIELIEEFGFTEESDKWKVIANSIRQKDLFTHNYPDHTLRTNMFEKPSGRETIIYTSVSDRFRLLDYLELKEAREGAATAKKNALWAIGISIIGLLASIGVSIWQMNSEPNVNRELMSQLEAQTRLLNNINPVVSCSQFDVQPILNKLDELNVEENK